MILTLPRWKQSQHVRPLRLETNLGVNINQGGFYVWSAVLNEFVSLSVLQTTDDNDFLISTYSYTKEDRTTMMGLRAVRNGRWL